MPRQCTRVSVLCGRILKSLGSSYSGKDLSTLIEQVVELVHSYNSHAARYSTCVSMRLVGTAKGVSGIWRHSGLSVDPPKAGLGGAP